MPCSAQAAAVRFSYPGKTEAPQVTTVKSGVPSKTEQAMSRLKEKAPSRVYSRTTSMVAGTSDSLFASHRVRQFLSRTTLTSHRVSPGYRKAIGCASTASTCGTKKVVRFTGLTTTRKGDIWQVGSNTRGGPISNVGCVFLAGEQPNNSLNRSAKRQSCMRAALR